MDAPGIVSNQLTILWMTYTRIIKSLLYIFNSIFQLNWKNWIELNWKQIVWQMIIMTKIFIYSLLTKPRMAQVIHTVYIYDIQMYSI
jgi:hypothetical protein